MNHIRIYSPAIKISVFMILGLVVGLVYLNWKSSPSYMLSTLNDAIENHDMETFEEFVDIDGVTNSVVKQLQGLQSKANNTSSFGQEIQKIIAGLASEAISKAGREMAREYVEKGTPPDMSILGSPELARHLDVDDFSTRGWPKVKREGKVCRFTQTIHVERYKADTEITFLMRKKSGHWQIAELLSLEKTVADLDLMSRRWPYQCWSAAVERIARELGNTNVIGSALMAAACAYAHCDLNDEAERLEREVNVWLHDNEKEGDYWVVQCLLSRARYYWEIGNASQAAEIAEIAWKSAQTMPKGTDRDSIVWCYVSTISHFGNVEMATRVVQSIDNRTTRLKCVTSVAFETSLSLKDFDLAIPEVLDEVQTIDAAIDRVWLYGMLMCCASKEGSQEVCKNILTQARYEIDSISNDEDLVEAYSILAAAIVLSKLQDDTNFWARAEKLASSITYPDKRSRVDKLIGLEKVDCLLWEDALGKASKGTMIPQDKNFLIYCFIMSTLGERNCLGRDRASSVMTALFGPQP